MRMAVLVAVLLLAGCAAPDEIPAPTEAVPDTREAHYVNFTGTLRSLPMLPDAATDGFEVPSGTGRITATLMWSDPLAQLALDLDGPGTGGHDGGHYPLTEEGRAEADIPGPSLGDWTFRVSGERALDVVWSLVLFLAPDDALNTVLEARYILPSGSFFEINTEMEHNATMRWSWSIAEGTESDFNLHTHFDGEAQYLIEETTSSHEGNVTAHREGGYSLMWENPGTAPQTIVYKVWGAFTVHSYFPPR